MTRLFLSASYRPPFPYRVSQEDAHVVAGARAMMKYRQRSKTSGNGAESGSNGGGSGAAKSWGYANANTNGINAPPAGVPLPASGPPPRDFGVSLLGAKGAYGASGAKPAAAYATPPSSSGALPRKVRAASPQFSVSSTNKRSNLLCLSTGIVYPSN